MSADVLRQAAALMLIRAEAATASPWVKKRGPGEHVYGELGHTFVADTASREDMRHIASWHPAVALAVSAWLVNTAYRMDRFGVAPAEWSPALATARAYLGTDA